MKTTLRDRLLWAAATDATFERMVQDGRPVLSGRCIHCKKRHQLATDGTPLTAASLEHIEPRNHGGTHEARNLAVACRSCNSAKGRRLDCRRKDDPDLRRMVEWLQTQRAHRWREPPESWGLSSPPPEWTGDDTDDGDADSD